MIAQPFDVRQPDGSRRRAAKHVSFQEEKLHVMATIAYLLSADAGFLCKDVRGNDRNVKQMHQMDQVDRRIVSLLQADASLSHADLAEKVGASSASCWRRIKALEKAGILARTVRLVDQQAVGKGVNVMCNIRMRSHARDARQSFEDFVQTRPEIVECFSMSGEWDYLLRIVVSDVADYNAFLMQSLLGHPSVAGASSHFVLSMTKYTTAIPI